MGEVDGEIVSEDEEEDEKNSKKQKQRKKGKSKGKSSSRSKSKKRGKEEKKKSGRGRGGGGEVENVSQDDLQKLAMLLASDGGVQKLLSAILNQNQDIVKSFDSGAEESKVEVKRERRARR